MSQHKCTDPMIHRHESAESLLRPYVGWWDEFPTAAMGQYEPTSKPPFITLTNAIKHLQKTHTDKHKSKTAAWFEHHLRHDLAKHKLRLVRLTNICIYAHFKSHFRWRNHFLTAFGCRTGSYLSAYTAWEIIFYISGTFESDYTMSNMHRPERQSVVGIYLGHCLHHKTWQSPTKHKYCHITESLTLPVKCHIIWQAHIPYWSTYTCC